MPPQKEGESPDTQRAVARTAPNGETSIAMESYSGPIPHPRIIAEWERIVPGSADRILKKFEAQTDHRIKIEDRMVLSEIIRSIGGLIAGFIIAMTAIVGGIYTALQGQPWLGGGLTFTGLALIIGAFVADRFRSKQDKGDQSEKE